MAGDASAYSALGLQPDADPAAIERAYKRLIKLYHPDREGGDLEKAAEVNRAYRELRAGFAPRDELIFTEDEPGRRSESKWVRTAVGLVVALVVLLAVTGPVAAYIRSLVPVSAGSALQARAVPAADPMDQPLDIASIDSAIRDAVRAGGDDVSLIGSSRNCYRQLRTAPTIARLDRCAAFDDAVVALQDRDPMWDQGPFSQIAVTGRQWSAATALSNDYLAIDGRLDRIRVHVELALARAEPVPVAPPASPVAEEAEQPAA